MSDEPNLYRPRADEYAGREAHDGFLAQRSYLGRRLGSTRLGASQWVVPPGQAAYPYHYHLGEEELLLVLEGSGRLRTPEGWRTLERGAVLSFPTGTAGAHQVLNDGAEPLVFVTVSTAGAPDICVYPDSGTLCAAERGPGGSGIWEMHRRADAVGYWDGVAAPEPDASSPE